MRPTVNSQAPKSKICWAQSGLNVGLLLLGDFHFGSSCALAAGDASRRFEGWVSCGGAWLVPFWTRLTRVKGAVHASFGGAKYTLDI